MAGLGVGLTASLEVGREASPKEQEVELEVVQVVPKWVEEGVVVGKVVSDGTVGEELEEKQGLVMVQEFGV